MQNAYPRNILESVNWLILVKRSKFKSAGKMRKTVNSDSLFAVCIALLLIWTRDVFDYSHY